MMELFYFLNNLLRDYDLEMIPLDRNVEVRIEIYRAYRCCYECDRTMEWMYYIDSVRTISEPEETVQEIASLHTAMHREDAYCVQLMRGENLSQGWQKMRSYLKRDNRRLERRKSKMLILEGRY